MSEKIKLVPKRRLKEFQTAGEWEQRKLGDISEIMAGGTPSTQIESYWMPKEIPWLSSGEVHKKRITYTDNMISKNGLENSSARWIKENSVLVALAGQGKTRGTVAINLIPLTTNQSIAAIVLNKELHYEFVFQNLANRYDELRTLSSADGSRGGLNKQILSELNVRTPQFEEQQRIGQFFQNLDNLITLHQRKLEKMKALKSAYLSEMFPAEGEREPKRRFAGFTGAWEQRKWSETVDISTEMVDPRCGDYDDLPHVAPGNIESFTGQLYDNVKSVKEENLISGKFHFRQSDVIYGKINPQLGKYVFATFEGLTSADAYVLNAKNNLNQKYLFVLLQTNNFFNYSVSVSKRSGMPKINRSELNAYSFLAPSIDEQEKIGSMFLKIDNLITLQQGKLEKLQNIKKAYLNEMFL